MSKGPKMNKINSEIIKRNNLGIEGVSLSIQDSICPIVTTATTRAFYWVFLTWIYYDLRNLGVNKIDNNIFYKHRRRQDYFFILSNLLIPESNQTGIVGIKKATENIEKNQSGYFEYDDTYYKAEFGGMNYFNSGLLTMGIINDRDKETNEKYSFPHVTETGKKIALAFESIIKNTTYYQEYRLQDKPVPKDVLVEYGKVINIGLIGFDEVKELMRNLMFKESNATFKKLIESYEYLKFLNHQYNITELDEKLSREIFFDYFSERCEHPRKFPEELKNIINQWEVVIGRQYFTTSLTIIWAYMLKNLNTLKDESTWIEDCLELSNFDIDINSTMSSIIDSCNYNYQTREDMVTKCQKNLNNNNPSNFNIQYALQIIISIYNRLKDREDFNNETISYLYEGKENDSLSLSELLEKIDEYKEKPVKEFLEYIMLNWIIRQHEKTAFSKLIQGKNGYYIEKNDGKYFKKQDYDEIEFQGIRMVQLMHVMKDLDMLEVK